MKKKIHFSLAAVTFFFGLLLAVQYTNVQDPIVVDTRDINQLRDELKKQEELQTHLVAEIKKNEAQLESFHMSLDNEYADVLNENIDQRREEIGLTEVKGKGLMITIDVMDFGIVSDNFTPYLSPDLLNRFLNELKSLGAEEICVGDERIIATSAVREVNGRVLLNHTPLPSFPIEIKIITNHPLRMESGLDISYIQDDFALENLQMKISKVDEIITLPAYSKPIHFQGIKKKKK